MSPLSHSSLTEKVYQQLRDGIRDGQFPPGERLMYERIGKPWGVSVTPWREALSMLEKEGIVVNIPRGGSYVREHSPAEIQQLYDIREALEGLAARLAAHSAEMDDIENIERAVRAFEESAMMGNTKDCVRHDFEFHERILALSKNSELKRILASLHLPIIGIIETGSNYPVMVSDYVQDHYEILDAIRRRSPAEAEQRMREHISKGKELVAAYEATEGNENSGDGMECRINQ